MAGYIKKAAQQAKAVSNYKTAAKTLKRLERSNSGASGIGKMLAKASANYKGAEGPKKSVKGPVRGGPATGKGKPANKRMK